MFSSGPKITSAFVVLSSRLYRAGATPAPQSVSDLPYREKIVSLVLLTLLIGCGRQSPRSEDVRSELFSTSPPSRRAASDEEWTAALSPREFTFPSDHGAHEDYRIEWWYYTGNLEAKDGRRLGYQLTFFRTGLHKQPTNPSRWAVRDLYTAHFAVSDIDSAEHHCFQRNNRKGIGQAGARTGHYEVWNGDWRAWLAG